MLSFAAFPIVCLSRPVRTGGQTKGKSMKRKLTASIVAISITLSSISAAPAQARNGDQFGQFIAGAIAILIFREIIENGGNPAARPPVGKPRKPKINKKLSAECYFKVRDRSGKRGVYGKRCLLDTMRHARKLPEQCETRVRIRQGKRANVYDARCLRYHGYKSEVRRW